MSVLTAAGKKAIILITVFMECLLFACISALYMWFLRLIHLVLNVTILKKDLAAFSSFSGYMHNLACAFLGVLFWVYSV